MDDMSADQLEDIYKWIDEIPLSRPKKNIARDFSDGGKNYLAHRVRCSSLEVLTCRTSL